MKLVKLLSGLDKENCLTDDLILLNAFERIDALENALELGVRLLHSICKNAYIDYSETFQRNRLYIQNSYNPDEEEYQVLKEFLDLKEPEEESKDEVD